MPINSNDPNIIFFKTPADFRKWLEKNHAKKNEQWVGFHKTGSGKKSITWPESVDQALCFGWIDGLRKGIDEESYKIRFTPRKKSSIWSAVNLKKVDELKKAGLMQEAGLKIFNERNEKNAEKYSFEQKDEIKFLPSYEKKFKANKAAWKWFSASAPSYKKAAMWWVMQAKQEATQLKRLETLIADAANGERIKEMRVRKFKKE
jgi:uncharacterized protein YdeI (YjbR/CyaY-like superfamily)